MASTSSAERKVKALRRATVVVKPVHKHVLSSFAVGFLERHGQVVDFQRRRRCVFATYSSPEMAALAVRHLDGIFLQDAPVSVSLFEDHAVSRNSEGASLRDMEAPAGTVVGARARQFEAQGTASTTASIAQGEAARRPDHGAANAARLAVMKTEAEPARPRPAAAAAAAAAAASQGFTGRYLVQLLRLSLSKNARTASLVRVLANKRACQAKEVSESFAVVRALFDFDASQRLGLRNGTTRVLVVVPGDGRRPFTAAALLLQAPNTWRALSVDPLLLRTATTGRRRRGGNSNGREGGGGREGRSGRTTKEGGGEDAAAQAALAAHALEDQADRLTLLPCKLEDVDLVPYLGDGGGGGAGGAGEGAGGARRGEGERCGPLRGQEGLRRTVESGGAEGPPPPPRTEGGKAEGGRGEKREGKAGAAGGGSGGVGGERGGDGVGRAVEAVVVLAVHSHAPLQAFWARLPKHLHRVCVSLPCCGDYGWLSTGDLRRRYVDPEVDSPSANTVLVYERPPEIRTVQEGGEGE